MGIYNTIGEVSVGRRGLKENLDFHFNPFPLLTFNAIGVCHVVRKYRGDKCLSLGYRLLANIPAVAIDSISNKYFLAVSRLRNR